MDQILTNGTQHQPVEHMLEVEEVEEGRESELKVDTDREEKENTCNRCLGNLWFRQWIESPVRSHTRRSIRRFETFLEDCESKNCDLFSPFPTLELGKKRVLQDLVLSVSTNDEFECECECEFEFERFLT